MHLRKRGHDFILPNIKYDFNKCHFITCSLFIMSKFYVFVLRAVRVCILYELFISSIMLCTLLSYVNTCTCHVYFTINLLTYCLHMVQLMPLPSQNQPVIPVVVLLTLLVLYVAGSVNGTVSVRLSVPSCYSVRQVCCCQSCGREILTAVGAQQQRRRSTALSCTLTGDKSR